MRRLIAALAIVTVTLSTAPAVADPRGHDGFRGPSGDSHARHFDGHRGFDRGAHGRFFFGFGPSIYIGPAYQYVPPAYVYAPPPTAYWYYCPGAGAYYPYVQSCPEAWVPVPAAAQ